LDLANGLAKSNSNKVDQYSEITYEKETRLNRREVVILFVGGRFVNFNKLNPDPDIICQSINFLSKLGFH
jgi:hypothetical protein